MREKIKIVGKTSAAVAAAAAVAFGMSWLTSYLGVSDSHERLLKHPLVVAAVTLAVAVLVVANEIRISLRDGKRQHKLID